MARAMPGQGFRTLAPTVSKAPHIGARLPQVVRAEAVAQDVSTGEGSP